MKDHFNVPSMAEYRAQLANAEIVMYEEIQRLLASGYHWEADGYILVKRDDHGEIESTVEF